MEKEVEFEDPSQNVDEEIERKLERAELIKAIKQLSEDQRALVVLRDIRGFSYWEIADMLNLKLGTVKSKISRARTALKEILERSGYFFEIVSITACSCFSLYTNSRWYLGRMSSLPW